MTAAANECAYDTNEDVAVSCFGLYCKVHSVRNPDITQDWNQILASIAGLKFCMLSNETDAPSLPMEDVTASPQYAKQKTTVGMSLNFSTASSNLSLLVPLTLAVSSQGQSPAYLHAKLQGWELGLKGSTGKESLNLTLLFYSQPKADPTTNGTSVETGSTFTCLRVTAPTYILPQTKRPPECPVINERNSPMNAITTTWKKQKFLDPSECYSLKFTSDPSLTVMLSQEERALAGYHLIITSASLLFVCGVLCIHSCLPSPKSQGCQDNGRDLKEPLIES
ncbi:hypothetical protein GJAV_G00028740 [Gymnothorax javanicus]|nr:hypothetical protein GJAV_G00028740 [Gymnothorax javanicus]